eukprot:TRINITY_DN971_c0_g1_i1.p1 TRINITY_DN971_c0_g1~~TRINITY_DN971_c0_g1_i1.p1  ORF type:complete len:492 (+),score=87.05 TRINITY_DN971_c0_g1_i1:78-1478(+)
MLCHAHLGPLLVATLLLVLVAACQAQTYQGLESGELNVKFFNEYGYVQRYFLEEAVDRNNYAYVKIAAVVRDPCSDGDDDDGYSSQPDVTSSDWPYETSDSDVYSWNPSSTSRNSGANSGNSGSFSGNSEGSGDSWRSSNSGGGSGSGSWESGDSEDGSSSSGPFTWSTSNSGGGSGSGSWESGDSDDGSSSSGPFDPTTDSGSGSGGHTSVTSSSSSEDPFGTSSSDFWTSTSSDGGHLPRCKPFGTSQDPDVRSTEPQTWSTEREDGHPCCNKRCAQVTGIVTCGIDDRQTYIGNITEYACNQFIFRGPIQCEPSQHVYILLIINQPMELMVVGGYGRSMSKVATKTLRDAHKTHRKNNGSPAQHSPIQGPDHFDVINHHGNRNHHEDNDLNWSGFNVAVIAMISLIALIFMVLVMTSLYSGAYTAQQQTHTPTAAASATTASAHSVMVKVGNAHGHYVLVPQE